MNLKQKNANKIANQIAEYCEMLWKKDNTECPETALEQLMNDTDNRLHKFFKVVFEARNFTNYFRELEQEQAEWFSEMQDRQFRFQGGEL